MENSKHRKLKKDDGPERTSERSVGRKRNPALSDAILEACIELLADEGFDRMTMDTVATRAKVGKAALYRRWSSKVALVRDALGWMNRGTLNIEHLPDMGNLRDDFLATVQPTSLEYGRRKLRVLAGLGSFFAQVPEVVEQNEQIFAARDEVNRRLIRRAMDRGEISKDAPVDWVCETMNAAAVYRGLILRKAFDKEWFVGLIDCIVLPALRSPPARKANKH